MVIGPLVAVVVRNLLLAQGESQKLFALFTIKYLEIYHSQGSLGCRESWVDAKRVLIECSGLVEIPSSAFFDREGELLQGFQGRRRDLNQWLTLLGDGIPG